MVILERSIGNFNGRAWFAGGNATRRDGQIVDEALEAGVVGPVQFRGTHVYIAFVEGLDVESVGSRAFQPEPVTGEPGSLRWIHLRET